MRLKIYRNFVMEEKLISKKKPTYPINRKLYNYLSEFNRNIKIPVFYDDLLRFSGSVTVYDKNDKDTLWIRVYYPEFEQIEIDMSLKRMYNILHGDGSEDNLDILNGTIIQLHQLSSNRSKDEVYIFPKSLNILPMPKASLRDKP